MKYNELVREIEKELEENSYDSEMEKLDYIENNVSSLEVEDSCKIIRSSSFPDEVTFKPSDLLPEREKYNEDRRRPYKTKKILQEIIYEALFDKFMK